MERSCVHFDLGGQVGAVERLAKHCLDAGVLPVIAFRNRDQRVHVYFLNQQVCAIGLVGHHGSAMEACDGPDAVRKSRRRAQCVGPSKKQ